LLFFPRFAIHPPLNILPWINNDQPLIFRLSKFFVYMFLPNLVTILTKNVQIVGNDEYLILDIEVGSQGANQDARIWENSNVNQVTGRTW
jgi:hypothetical protein